MRRLAGLRLAHLALISAAWAVWIILLPRLVLWAVAFAYRLRLWLSPQTDSAIAFGNAQWSNRSAMLMAAMLPPALLLGAWLVSHLLHRDATP